MLPNDLLTIMPAPVHSDQIQTSPSWTRVAIVGEVDLSTGPRLQGGLLEVLAAQSASVLELDLSEVTFLDCSGLRALLAVRAAAAETGCRVMVSHPQPIVGRVLTLTGLLPLLTT
jgi:anti-anti-sigma factor